VRKQAVLLAIDEPTETLEATTAVPQQLATWKPRFAYTGSNAFSQISEPQVIATTLLKSDLPNNLYFGNAVAMRL
jgi:hypothetical protein